VTINYDEQQELANMSIDELLADIDYEACEAIDDMYNVVDLSYLDLSMDDM